MVYGVLGFWGFGVLGLPRTNIKTPNKSPLLLSAYAVYYSRGTNNKNTSTTCANTNTNPKTPKPQNPMM